MNTPKNPCWYCAKSGYGRASECPWEREFKPVPGWIARETTHKNGKSSGGYTSYEIKYCPLFVPDRKTQQPKQPAPEAFAKRKQRKPKHIEEATDDLSRLKSEVENELVGMRGAERTKARRAALKRRGVCVTCTAALAKSGYASCAKCLNYFAERHRKRREEKARSGVSV